LAVRQEKVKLAFLIESQVVKRYFAWIRRHRVDVVASNGTRGGKSAVPAASASILRGGHSPPRRRLALVLVTHLSASRADLLAGLACTPAPGRPPRDGEAASCSSPSWVRRPAWTAWSPTACFLNRSRTSLGFESISAHRPDGLQAQVLASLPGWDPNQLRYTVGVLSNPAAMLWGFKPNGQHGLRGGWGMYCQRRLLTPPGVQALDAGLSTATAKPTVVRQRTVHHCSTDHPPVIHSMCVSWSS